MRFYHPSIGLPSGAGRRPATLKIEPGFSAARSDLRATKPMWSRRSPAVRAEGGMLVLAWSAAAKRSALDTTSREASPIARAHGSPADAMARARSSGAAPAKDRPTVRAPRRVASSNKSANGRPSSLSAKGPQALSTGAQASRTPRTPRRVEFPSRGTCPRPPSRCLPRLRPVAPRRQPARALAIPPAARARGTLAHPPMPRQSSSDAIVRDRSAARPWPPAAIRPDPRPRRRVESAQGLPRLGNRSATSFVEGAEACVLRAGGEQREQNSALFAAGCAQDRCPARCLVVRHARSVAQYEVRHLARLRAMSPPPV